MSQFGFQERLAFSRGVRKDTHPKTIQSLIHGCVDVRQASLELDKSGVDFIATLFGGSEVFIDLKTRDRGCSKFWRRIGSQKEPELALETWSVIPNFTEEEWERPCPPNEVNRYVGWTLNEGKKTDYTLHVFDPSDSMEVFLLPFQLLRQAFIKKKADWMQRFKTDIQETRERGKRWNSECVFVPASLVLEAIQNEMRSAI